MDRSSTGLNKSKRGRGAGGERVGRGAGVLKSNNNGRIRWRLRLKGDNELSPTRAPWKKLLQNLQSLDNTAIKRAGTGNRVPRVLWHS